jgi:hypothetical protein
MPQPNKPNPIQDYITVNERVEKFYAEFVDGRIITHIVEHDSERGFILMRAEVFRNFEDDRPIATGHAYELKSEGYVQRTSYLEVCETSAVGRALALAGYEVKKSIASREEIEKAERMRREQDRKPEPPKFKVPAQILSLKNSPNGPVFIVAAKDIYQEIQYQIKSGEQPADIRAKIGLSGGDPPLNCLVDLEHERGRWIVKEFYKTEEVAEK